MSIRRSITWKGARRPAAANKQTNNFAQLVGCISFCFVFFFASAVRRLLGLHLRRAIGALHPTIMRALVCVCVCVWERERESRKLSLHHNANSDSRPQILSVHSQRSFKGLVPPTPVFLKQLFDVSAGWLCVALFAEQLDWLLHPSHCGCSYFLNWYLLGAGRDTVHNSTNNCRKSHALQLQPELRQAIYPLYLHLLIGSDMLRPKSNNIPFKFFLDPAV